MDADAARARFAAASAAHLSAPLEGGIEIVACDQATLRAENERLWQADTRGRARLEPLYRDEEAARLRDLGAVLGEPLTHRLLLVRGGEVVGAFWGQQEAWGRYYMVTSVVAPALRGRGVYAAMLARIVATARDAGFQEVTSRHRADNNAILIAKLKVGFTIGGFEISTRWGLLVHLRRYLLESLEAVHRYRVDGSDAAALRALDVID